MSRTAENERLPRGGSGVMNPRWHVAKIVVTPAGARPVFVRGARRWVLVGLREARRALNALGAPETAYRIASVYYAILDRA